MAILASIATGNFTAAATWGLVDGTSYTDGQGTGNAFSTSYSVTNRTTAFTPGAIVVSHIGFKLANRTGTTGTLKLHIALDTTFVEVAGTEVTINCADLPVAATADVNGGWHFLKLATPVTLLAATAYVVEGKTSSANQITPFSHGGNAQNFSIALITTTTQAPVAGDDMIIAGEYTGAGTSNSFTVTMDETATTDYGSAPTAANSLITPGIAVCNKGTLTWGTTAATNYNLKLSNSFIIYTGGTHNMGTTGTPCPRDSTMTLQFDPGTNVNYGWIVRNLGTFNAQGLSRTSGKDIWYCKLNTDEAVASTSLGVDTDTGWLDNDEIAVASTTRTNSDCEAGALNGAAGASTLTVDGFAGAGGGLAVAHSGTSPTQAEIILLTRNVVIRGASTTLQAYGAIEATSTIDFDWVEFKWHGSATTNKRGINVNTTTGSCNIQYCSIHDFRVASSVGFLPSTNAGGYTISNNCFWNTANSAIGFNSTSTLSNWIISGNIAIRCTDASTSIYNLLDIGGTFTNNTAAGATNAGITFNESSGVLGTVSGNITHSCSGPGVVFQGTFMSGTISNTTSWRNNTSGITFSIVMPLSAYFILDTATLFGNGASNIIVTSAVSGVILQNITSNGDSTFSTSNGILSNTSGSTYQLTIINSDFSTVGGIKTAHTNDFNISSNLFQIYCINCKLGGTNEVTNQTSTALLSFVSSQKHDQTSGLHKLWKRFGNIVIETGTVHSGTTSMAMSPNSSSSKLESSGSFGGFKVQVANGQTCTPSVYVYENGTYNGNRARLVVKRNDALGITADTTLDTATAASDLAWEQLTGTTAAVTDNGVLEFVVDCDGTAGTLYVDTFTATVA